MIRGVISTIAITLRRFHRIVGLLGPEGALVERKLRQQGARQGGLSRK
jgi:hypothetical protein